MQRASIYKRSQFFYFAPLAKTTAGVWIITSTVRRVSADSTKAAIGEACQSAWNNSSLSIPHPTDWKGVIDPLLKLADTKSWSAFARNSSLVNTTITGEKIEYELQRNLGPKEGFRPISRFFEMPLDSTQDEIGNRLVEAFELLNSMEYP